MQFYVRLNWILNISFSYRDLCQPPCRFKQVISASLSANKVADVLRNVALYNFLSLVGLEILQLFFEYCWKFFFQLVEWCTFYFSNLEKNVKCGIFYGRNAAYFLYIWRTGMKSSVKTRFIFVLVFGIVTTRTDLLSSIFFTWILDYFSLWHALWISKIKATYK